MADRQIPAVPAENPIGPQHRLELAFDEHGTFLLQSLDAAGAVHFELRMQPFEVAALGRVVNTKLCEYLSLVHMGQLKFPEKHK